MRNMVKFDSGAIREDKTGKGRMDLLPMCSLIRLSKHMEDSLDEHPERNWEKGLPMHSFMDSALRHIAEYMDGKDDEDHLCAAAWNILCAMWTEEKRPEMQDIPSRMKTTLNENFACMMYAADGVAHTCGVTGEVSSCEGDIQKCTLVKSEVLHELRR